MDNLDILIDSISILPYQKKKDPTYKNDYISGEQIYINDMIDKELKRINLNKKDVIDILNMRIDNLNGYCKGYKLLKIDTENNKALIKEANCKNYLCQRHSHINKYKLNKKFENILKHYYKNNFFLTLTIKDYDILHKKYNNNNVFRILTKIFDNFNRLLRKKYKYKYIKVVEFQKRGAIHYHIILLNVVNKRTNKYVNKIDINFLYSQWHRLTGSKHIYIERTKGKNIKNYLLKYITKTIDTIDKSIFINDNRKIDIDYKINVNDIIINSFYIFIIFNIRRYTMSRNILETDTGEENIIYMQIYNYDTDLIKFYLKVCNYDFYQVEYG